MKDKVATILKIFLGVLLAISAVLAFIFYFWQGEDFTNTMLTWSYILLGLTAVLTIAFPVVYIAMNPMKGKSVFIGILGFVALYLISHAIASGDIIGNVYEKHNITEGTSRFVGAMLNATYILAALAVLSIIYSGISSLFNR
jgi:hypothetical protein